LEKEVELRQWQLNIMFNNMKDAKVIDVLLKAQDALEKAMFVMESQDLMVSDAYDAAKEALNEITELLNSEA
jgi:CRISPR/Cas system-associated endonuclease Cas3-HD